jgi:hypothetical protein
MIMKWMEVLSVDLVEDLPSAVLPSAVLLRRSLSAVLPRRECLRSVLPSAVLPRRECLRSVLPSVDPLSAVLPER